MWGGGGGGGWSAAEPGLHPLLSRPRQGGHCRGAHQEVSLLLARDYCTKSLLRRQAIDKLEDTKNVSFLLLHLSRTWKVSKIKIIFFSFNFEQHRCLFEFLPPPNPPFQLRHLWRLLLIIVQGTCWDRAEASGSVLPRVLPPYRAVVCPAHSGGQKAA